MVPTILLYSPHPAFFERRDTWFNRRGVDVFCAMDVDTLANMFSHRRMMLVLTQGVPDGMTAHEMRQIIPPQVRMLVLTEGGDDEDLLATYEADPDCKVLRAPFGEQVTKAARNAMTIPPRHYLRILVQIQADGGGTFGFSNNISTTGMLLETKRQLNVGDTVALSFMLPGASQMSAAHALVVRQAPSQGAYRFGLRFVDLPAVDCEFLSGLRAQTEAKLATA
jgi:hypothetical protein